MTESATDIFRVSNHPVAMQVVWIEAEVPVPPAPKIKPAKIKGKVKRR